MCTYTTPAVLDFIVSILIDWINFKDMVCSISTCTISLQQPQIFLDRNGLLFRHRGQTNTQSLKMGELKHAFVDELLDSVYAYHVRPWTQDQQVVLCFHHLAQFLV